MALSSPRRVIIFGTHTPDWMAALSPGAAVWRHMPGVQDVTMVPDLTAWPMPPANPEPMPTVVIPLLEHHIRVCPRHHLALIPDLQSVGAFGNKLVFSDYVTKNGLDKYCAQTFSDIDSASYPCVVKVINGHSGFGLAVAASARHLEFLLEQSPWTGQAFIIQSLVGGEKEYVTHCVCRNGRVLWHCSFAYVLFEGEVIRSPYNVKSIHPIALTEQTIAEIEEFTRPLSYTGPLNVDYKFSDSGRIVVFEINPRLGGSLMRPENLVYLQQALSCIVRNAEPYPAVHWAVPRTYDFVL